MSKTKEFEIEVGIPVPDVRNGGGASTKYPWPDMEHGDSFTVAIDEDEPKKVLRRVYVSGRSWCRRHKPHLKPIVRYEPEEGEPEVVRCWLSEAETESDD